MKFWLAIVTTAIICLLANCSGGFGTDCGEAKYLGPGIFGPDST